MTLTETTLLGGGQTAHARRVRKHAQVLNLDPDGTELVAMMVNVNDLRTKTFTYINRSAGNAHTVKIYHCPARLAPTAITDDDVVELDSFSIAAATPSDPLRYEGDYNWMIITYNGAAESNISDCYFEGTKD